MTERPGVYTYLLVLTMREAHGNLEENIYIFYMENKLVKLVKLAPIFQTLQTTKKMDQE